MTEPRKTRFFYSFSSKQCSLIINEKKFSCSFTYLTKNLLHTVNFSNDKIDNIIQHLHLNKDDHHDKISIRMFNICGILISKPAEIICKECLEIEIEKFSPIHKKSDKQ